MPRIAVVVPVYNRPTLVRDALDSVALQSRQPDVLVVVDDGSTDRTWESVEQWERAARREFSIVKVRQSNRGVAAARNRGLREVDCSHVAFLDSDDLWPSDFLARAMARIQVRSRAVAVTCDRRIEDTTSGEVQLKCSAGLEDNATEWLLLNDAGIASASLFEASRIRQLGGFPEHLRTSEDAELFLRLTLQGRWLHASGAPVTFRHRAAEAVGEAANLSLNGCELTRTHAEVVEQFIIRQGGWDVVSRSVYGHLLSDLWYRAGRHLLQGGQAVESRECFQRSTQWRVCNRAWLRWMQSYLPRAA